MPGVQKSIRLPEEMLKEIERLARETGRDFSAITKDLLEEAIKMRRCPGIVFVEGTTGRKARVAGTGVEVWEMVATHQSMNMDFERLKKAYHWLAPEQLRAALAYYSAFPQEIDQQIEKNERWDEKEVKRRHPLLAGSA